MRTSLLLIPAICLLAAPLSAATDEKPDMSGTWKLDPARSDIAQTSKETVLLVEYKGEDIHIRETRGSDAKQDVSEFTCDTMGTECAMLDGGGKAKVTVYYNGPALVILKTHGRKGTSVEKRLLSLSSTGDALTVEVTPIEPAGKAEKLVFSKAQ